MDAELDLYSVRHRDEIYLARARDDDEAERISRRHMKAHPSVMLVIGKEPGKGSRRVTFKRVDE